MDAGLGAYHHAGYLNECEPTAPSARQNPRQIARDGNIFEKKVAAKEVFGSNLFLANREARLAAPSGKDSSGQNQWAALRAAHELASKKPFSFVVVGDTGFEPVASTVSR